MSIVRPRVVGHCTLTNCPPNCMFVPALCKHLCKQTTKFCKIRILWAGSNPIVVCLVNRINTVQVIKDCGRSDYGLSFPKASFCRSDFLFNWIYWKFSCVWKCDQAKVENCRCPRRDNPDTSRDNWTWQPMVALCPPQMFFLCKWFENVQMFKQIHLVQRTKLL